MRGITVKALRARVDALSRLHNVERWDLAVDLLKDIIMFLEQREPLVPKHLGRYEPSAKKYGRKGKASNP